MVLVAYVDDVRRISSLVLQRDIHKTAQGLIPGSEVAFGHHDEIRLEFKGSDDVASIQWAILEIDGIKRVDWLS
jgi:hypothetical protein